MIALLGFILLSYILGSELIQNDRERNEKFNQTLDEIKAINEREMEFYERWADAAEKQADTQSDALEFMKLLHAKDLP